MADGESYKSWAWWLDALQAMRRTYSIPMDAKEARIRSDVDFDNARRKVCRAMVEEARRKDQLLEEEEAVRCWAKTGDPEAEAYREGLDDLLQEMTGRMSSEERDEWSTTPDREAFEAACYRHKWSSAHRRGEGSSYEDTTGILAMQFTDAEPADRWYARPTGTLQIFSFKVAAIAEEL